MIFPRPHYHIEFLRAAVAVYRYAVARVAQRCLHMHVAGEDLIILSVRWVVLPNLRHQLGALTTEHDPRNITDTYLTKQFLQYYSPDK